MLERLFFDRETSNFYFLIESHNVMIVQGVSSECELTNSLQILAQRPARCLAAVPPARIRESPQLRVCLCRTVPARASATSIYPSSGRTCAYASTTFTVSELLSTTSVVTNFDNLKRASRRVYFRNDEEVTLLFCAIRRSAESLSSSDSRDRLSTLFRDSRK